MMTSLAELGYSKCSDSSPNYNTINGFGLSSRSSRQFTSVSRKDPCPICGKDHGCSRTQDGAVLCRREPGVFGETLNGFRCISERGSKEHSVWRPADEWREGRQYQPQYVKKEPVKKIKEYSATERDSLNRQILDQLTLDPKHKQDLLNRGLSEDAIEKYKFRSVEPYQKVDLDLPEDFSSGSGNGLHTFRSGFMIPIFDVNGYITGFQYRPDNPGTGGKYLMVSKDSRISMKGEVPITVIKRSDKEFYPTAVITEGSLKPIVASDKQGFDLVIGMLVFSPNLLVKTLLKLGIQQVVICPDAGDVRNEAVMNKWSKVIELVKSLGIECHILWYGQTTKDDDDIDEIPSLEGTRLIAPDEFLQKAPNKKYNPDFGQEFTPTMKAGEVTIPCARVVHLRAGMGVGKTQKAIELAKVHVSRGGRVVYITHRNSLSRQFIARAAAAGISIIHVLDDPLLVRDRDTNMACCIDSLHRIVDTIDENTLIIIDEIQGFLEHTRTNKTSRELERVLTLGLRSCGRIITMDAHLTDLAAETIDILSGKGKSVKVLVELPLTKYPVMLIKGRDKQYETIQRGGKLLVCTDSKVYAKKTKNCAIAWGVSPERILLVTSETIKEENVVRFMSDPDGELLRHQYDVVIVSPSCESGLSIQSRGYFERVCARFVGVVTVETAAQMLGRLRDPAPRFVECLPKGVNAVDDDTLQGKQSRLQAQFSELKGMIREGDESNFDAIVQYTIESGKAFMKYDAITDFVTSTSKCNYRDNVISFLRQQGFDVEIDDSTPYTKDIVKKIDRTYDLEQAQKLREATPYETIQEATNIQCPTENQNLKIQRTFLEESNPGLVEICSDDALVEIMNNKRTVHAINRHIAVKSSNERPVLAVTEEMGQTMSAPDLVRSKKSDVIKSIVYNLLGPIDALLRMDRYCYKSKEVEDLLEAAKPYALALGIKPKYTPNQSIRTIVELIGYGTQLVAKCKEDGKRVRYYKVVQKLGVHDKVVQTNKWVVSAPPKTEVEMGTPPQIYIKDLSKGGVSPTEIIPTPRVEVGTPPLSYIEDLSRGGVDPVEIVPPPQTEVGTPPPIYIKDLSKGGVSPTENVPTPQLESGPPPFDSYIEDISRGGVDQNQPNSILDFIEIENHSLVYKLFYNDPNSGVSVEALGYHIIDAVKSLGNKLSQVGIILTQSDYDALILQG